MTPAVALARALLETELATLEAHIDPARPFDPGISRRVDALLEALAALEFRG